MKKIIFVLFVTVSMLFVSCQAKYREVTLEDGTKVYTLESDDVDSARVKRLLDKTLTVAEQSIDEALSAQEEYKKFEDDVSARMEQRHAEMDKFTEKYFPELVD